MILKNKKILVTGVLNRQSIAFHTAKKIQELGGEIILTGGPGKTARLTGKAAGFMDPVPPVVQMDVTDPGQVNDVFEFVKNKWGEFDGLLHSIGYAPPSCLGGNFAETPWEDVGTAFEISAYSLARLGSVFSPIMKNGSIVALDFDASVAWAYYNWMGVCKAGLESIGRYLAKDLGARFNIRVNLIAAGPVKSMAAKSIPESGSFDILWEQRAILDWDVKEDAASVADTAAFLFSDLSRKITGEIIHVDAGFHAMGSPIEGKREKGE